MSERSDKQLEQDMEDLLRLGREEVPPPDAKAQALERLLKGEVVAPPLDPSSGSGAIALRKWAAYGFTVVSIILAFIYFSRGEPPPTPLTVETPPVVAPVPVVVAPPPVVEPPQIIAEVKPPEPTPQPPEPPPQVKPKVKVETGPPDDALERELALVDEAKSLLTTNPSAAWATLSAHAKSFPRGALKQEADLLRVETLLKLGKRAEAAALAQQLSKRDTGGLLKERLERLMAPAP